MRFQSKMFSSCALAAVATLTPMNLGRSFADEAKPGEWATYGRTYANQRYSPLKQINRSRGGIF